MKKLNPMTISGKEVSPLIEGGKGIAVSDGKSRVLLSFQIGRKCLEYFK